MSDEKHFGADAAEVSSAGSMPRTPESPSEDEIARYYWPKDRGEPAPWFRAAISDAHDTGIAFAVRRSSGSSREAELLAALKGYKAVLSPWVKRPPMLTFEQWDAAVERIETAIAKAEGKQP